MAHRPTPPPEIREFRTTAEIDHAISKLERRTVDVERLAADGVQHDDAHVANVQHSVRDTIRDVFGSGSHQFDRHQYFEVDG